jgi:hypothetical protein
MAETLRIHDAGAREQADGYSGPEPMDVHQAMERLLDLRVRLLDTERKSCLQDAEAIHVGLKALRGLVMAMDSVTGGGR